MKLEAWNLHSSKQLLLQQSAVNTENQTWLIKTGKIKPG